MSARSRLEALLAPAMLEALEDFIAERVAEALRAAAGAPAAQLSPWLTLEQAGEMLGVSADAVRMRVKRGRLDARHHGRRLYVSSASVTALGARRDGGQDRYSRADNESAPAALERPGAGTGGKS